VRENNAGFRNSLLTAAKSEAARHCGAGAGELAGVSAKTDGWPLHRWQQRCGQAITHGAFSAASIVNSRTATQVRSANIHLRC